MNLLTQEQQTIFNESRDTIATHLEWSKQQELNPIPAIYQAAESLVRIIDDLQARAPKQYTEQELREWMETCNNLSFADCPWVRHEPTHKLIKPEHMKYKDSRDEAMWFAVHNFARISGALKAEP